MNQPAAKEHRGRRRNFRLWFAVALAATVVLAANAHLIYVAMISQPACVAHLRQGEGSAGRSMFSAAQSSCVPSTSKDPGHS